jgi:hypothetical protein
VGETAETVQQAVEQVKRTFDLKFQVRERPWTMIGGAVVAGLVVGAVAGRRRRAAARGPAPRASAAQEQARPGFLAGLARQFDGEIGQVQELAVGIVARMIRDWIDEAVQAFRGGIDAAMNGATTRRGGERKQVGGFE